MPNDLSGRPSTSPSFFFIIGGQRCGSTTLRRSLDAHPDIQMLNPERPEPKTFIQPTFPRDACEYLRLFDAPHVPVLGEKSTSYFDLPGSAIAIHDRIPDAKIVVILRDPVDRAISHYRFSVGNGVEDLPMAEAFTAKAESRPFDPAKFSVSPYHYISRGKYASLLSPWVEEFDIDLVHVALLDKLRVDQTELANVHKFLGVTPLHTGLPPRSNESSGAGPGLPEPLKKQLHATFAEGNDELREAFGVDIGNWNG